MSIEVILLNIAVTALMYLAIPLCTVMLCWGFDKRLSKKAINRIAIFNALVVWLLVQVIKTDRIFILLPFSFGVTHPIGC